MPMDIPHIPDGEVLYRYIKPEALPDGQSEIPGGILQDKELSCDWEKFCKNPQDSVQVKNGKSIIIAINVCDEIRNPKNMGVRDINLVQEIIHEPVEGHILNDVVFEKNTAHSLIKGRKKKLVTDSIIRNSSFYKY